MDGEPGRLWAERTWGRRGNGRAIGYAQRVYEDGGGGDAPKSSRAKDLKHDVPHWASAVRPLVW